MTVILIFVLATGFANIDVQMPEMDGLQLQKELL
jgi:FixJ family two-component response regulator